MRGGDDFETIDELLEHHRKNPLVDTAGNVVHLETVCFNAPLLGHLKSPSFLFQSLTVSLSANSVVVGECPEHQPTDREAERGHRQLHEEERLRRGVRGFYFYSSLGQFSKSATPSRPLYTKLKVSLQHLSQCDDQMISRKSGKLEQNVGKNRSVAPSTDVLTDTRTSFPTTTPASSSSVRSAPSCLTTSTPTTFE